MPVTYNFEDAVAPLEIIGGIAAFDPTTLTIAAEALGEYGYDLYGQRGLAVPRSAVLERLAEVEAEPDFARALIDTGHLRWDPSLNTDASEIDDYDGRPIEAVALGEMPVARIDDVVLTTVPMVVGKADGASIEVWFAELPEELEQADGFELFHLATRLQEAWPEADTQLTYVTVPRQKLEYRSKISSALTCTNSELEITQKFKAEMDESGARVIAETVIVTGAPVHFPPNYDFGSRGPVIFWFSEDDGGLPFSIIYTSAEAWEAFGEGDELEIMGLV
ncbi:MAG: hypothetical protein SPK16_08975 [Corynebacterium sp.]|nr:hypothetical protein [Corynebacterium sp.]MDY5786201.1 hypothetical protein [Corynebacterium sp.]